MFFAHWIADFVVQSNQEAINKSSSMYWLLHHTFRYSMVLGTLMGLGSLYGLIGSLGGPLGPIMFIAINFLINFLAHTVTDFFTSRLGKYYWQKEERHNFFIVIGFDQFLHAVVLVLSYAILAV
jgi:hypothetical protein